LLSYHPADDDPTGWFSSLKPDYTVYHMA
jgi:hypothetical protein